VADNRIQLVVVGAGPGGYAAAFLAADLGMDVALVDRDADPGGVCLYRGCIPSKALLHVARILGEAREAKHFGVTFRDPEIDLERLRTWKDEVVGKLTGGLGQLARRRKVRFIQGKATFHDPHTLTVENPGAGVETLGFEHAIVATGSSPATLPGFPSGSDRILDSTSALELAGVPQALLVVGGGYIGLELGTVYAALGSRVTVIELTPSLLPGVDTDLVRPLAKRFEGRFEEILLRTRVGAIREQGDGVEVDLEGEGGEKRRATFDCVLVSVGRRPNSSGFGLENTRVEVDERGFIVVDGQQRTAEPSISAVGDVVGQPMLAHKAAHEGRTAVEVIAGHDVVFEPAAIPAVVFTDPEIAWCGLTETEAAQSGRVVEIARFPWAA
jgi:dihydrolipoamide dehydrogenase